MYTFVSGFDGRSRRCYYMSFACRVGARLITFGTSLPLPTLHATFTHAFPLLVPSFRFSTGLPTCGKKCLLILTTTNFKLVRMAGGCRQGCRLVVLRRHLLPEA